MLWTFLQPTTFTMLSSSTRQFSALYSSVRLFASRPYNILGVQQIAIGALQKSSLQRLYVDVFGLEKVKTFVSEKENVDEDVLKVRMWLFLDQFLISTECRWEPVHLQSRLI